MRRRVRRLVPAVLLAGLAFAAAAAAAPSVQAAEPAIWNHDPRDRVAGPAHWAELDPAWQACVDGDAQSPINLGRNAVRRELPALRFDYPRGSLAVKNTGHVIEVPSTGTLTVGRDTYSLAQFHVHAPSEHTVNGRHTDLEIHLVHADAQGRRAVVGLLLDAGPHGKALVSKIAAAAPHEAGEETETGTRFTPAELLPTGDRAAHYSTYAGSLTTPPCDEGVRWFVLDGVQQVSPAALRQLHTLISEFPGYHRYPDNFRPVQPLHGRTVLHTR